MNPRLFAFRIFQDLSVVWCVEIQWFEPDERQGEGPIFLATNYFNPIKAYKIKLGSEKAICKMLRFNLRKTNLLTIAQCAQKRVLDFTY